MTSDEVIEYQKTEARMAQRRASEVSEILGIPYTVKAAEEGIKKAAAEEILEMIGEIRKCQFYCMADLCPGKKDCATCALEYIEKRIKEEYKCKQV